MRCVPLIFRMYEFSSLPKKVMYELKMSVSALRKNSLKQLLPCPVLISFSWQMKLEQDMACIINVYLSLLADNTRSILLKLRFSCFASNCMKPGISS